MITERRYRTFVCLNQPPGYSTFHQNFEFLACGRLNSSQSETSSLRSNVFDILFFEINTVILVHIGLLLFSRYRGIIGKLLVSDAIAGSG
ncbi:hypothetical protein, partial [Streptococcus dysgalactiae]|uniref:hypothetical protein n=1 Tax=Streptococcus dysgalactiae TaxID=1334 RepID=UPI00195240E0